MSIHFVSLHYTPISLPLPLHITLFCSPSPELALRAIFTIIRFNLAPTSTFLLVRYTHSHLTTSHLASAFAFLFSRLAPQTTRLRLKHLNKPKARRPAVVSLCFAPCCEYCLDSIRELLGLLVLSTFVCLCLPSQTTVFTTIQTNNLNILKALGLTTPKHHNVPEHH
jgi:hypothetical protein